MFPVRAVNQILIEPLCKSVDGCAKTPGTALLIFNGAALTLLFPSSPYCRPHRQPRRIARYAAARSD
jgi:hypothetical protein